jgi:hypothetical protein
MQNERTIDIDKKLTDNCAREVLKDHDITTLDAVYHLMATCQVFTYLATHLDPDGKLTNVILTEEELKLLRAGMYISQSIASKIEKEVDRIDNK